MIPESGATAEPIPLVPSRRDAVHLWLIEMPTHSETWERTPDRGRLSEPADLVASQYGWMLALRD